MDREVERTMTSIERAMDGDCGRPGTAQRLAFELFVRAYQPSEIAADVLDAVSTGSVRRRLGDMTA